MKTYEKPSFWEYKKNPKYEWKPQTMDDIVGEYNLEAVDEKLVAGRIVKKTKYVKTNVAEDVRKFKVTDFCLENLVASGTELVKCPPLAGNTFENADAVQDGMITLNRLIELGQYENVGVENNDNKIEENE